MTLLNIKTQLICLFQDEDLYEFGPMLISKDPETRDTKAARRLNSETFRFSNSWPYPLKMSLEWENGPAGVFTAPPEAENPETR